MKKISAILALVLCVCMLAGCAGTPVVYYTNCTCPVEAHQEVQVEAPAAPVTQTPVEEVPAVEGAVKTGLAVVTGLGKSVSASAEGNGKADYDVTIVAVTVDDNGVIQSCIIDGIAASVEFDAAGAIVTDLTKPVQTKNELGPDYNMVAYGGASAEWYVQAKTYAATAVGKTAADISSLATEGVAGCTIAVDTYKAAIVEAVQYAR